MYIFFFFYFFWYVKYVFVCMCVFLFCQLLLKSQFVRFSPSFYYVHSNSVV